MGELSPLKRASSREQDDVLFGYDRYTPMSIETGACSGLTLHQALRERI
ncbi:MAG: hypothetical protein H0U84_06290 [Thermoleophilaceae bacterium]|nr:hypothetical protein [Thermoleophilaceae bacterium]